jgi:hypothetical protein
MVFVEGFKKLCKLCVHFLHLRILMNYACDVHVHMIMMKPEILDVYLIAVCVQTLSL